jgi:hypothetical protein
VVADGQRVAIVGQRRREVQDGDALNQTGVKNEGSRGGST